jgi:DNA polymerase III delta prime subunit
VTLKKRLEEMRRVLPEFDADSEAEHPIEAYFASVRAAIHGLPRWRIRSFLTLGHFAFGRLAMFQDIDPKQWANHPSQHDLVGAILRGAETKGDGEGEAMPRLPEDYEIDGLEVGRLAPLLVHDADASQHSAIVDVMKQENLVIGGPPGTGKSQTITNIIANALARDATTSVLFLSEKRAALEVVKRRLDSAGLGEFCLELHSEKSSPHGVIESLKERLESQPPARPANAMSPEAWKQARDVLSGYIEELHTPDEDGDTAFKLFWKSIAGAAPNADVPKEVRKAEIGERLLADPHEQRRLLAEVQFFGTLAEEFRDRHGPRALSPWAKLPLRARPSEHEDVLDDLQNLNTAVADARPVAQAANEHGLSYFDEDGLRAIARIPAPPRFENVEQLARIEPDEIERAVLLLASLRKIEAELAADPLDGAIRADELEAAARLAKQIFDPSLLALAPHEIQRRAEETARRAEQVVHRIDATRRMQELLGVDDHAPFEILPAICVAAIATSAVPVLLRGWLSWKPAGDERVYSRARERWSSLSAAERKWDERLSGYDTAARPDPSELREAAGVLSEKGVSLKLWRRADLKKAREVATGLGLNCQDAPTVLNEFATHLEALSAFERDKSIAQAVGVLWKGILTEFGVMDNAMKMKSFIASKLDPLEHGSRVGELLFNVGDHAVTELVAERDIAIANRKGAPEDDVDFRSYSIEQAYDAMKKGRRQAQAVLASEDLPAIADVPAPLGTLISRSRRMSERDRLAAQVASLEAAKTLEPMVQHARDIEAITSAAAWIKLVRSSGLPKGAIQRLLKADGAAVRESLIPVAEHAIEALEAEKAANVVVLQRYGSNFFGVPHEGLSEMLSSALERSRELREFLTLEDARRGLDESGLKSFMTAIEATHLSPARYSEVLGHVLVRRRAERIHQSRRKLSDASGAELNGRRKIFADHDKRKIAHDRIRAHQALSARQPPSGSRIGAQKHWTEMALINAEKVKEKRFLNVRSLLQQAKGAIRALKPCFMMSPMSVAKFLPRDMTFDLVIIDEASQMRPEDALGALLRTRQIVVVGDPKQLPPTDFFDRAMDSREQLLRGALLQAHRLHAAGDRPVQSQQKRERGPHVDRLLLRRRLLRALKAPAGLPPSEVREHTASGWGPCFVDAGRALDRLVIIHVGDTEPGLGQNLLPFLVGQCMFDLVGRRRQPPAQVSDNFHILSAFRQPLSLRRPST